MKRSRSCAVLIFVIFLFSTCVRSLGNDGQVGSGEQAKRPPLLLKTFRNTFSSGSASAGCPARTRYWDRIKTTINQAQAYLFPPNLDFRGSHEIRENRDANRAAEKVKEAVASSLEKSKATVEESAKSARKIAGETLQKTKEKVKKSLSGRGAEPDHTEL